MTHDLAVPTVHLNGTAKAALLDQISEAIQALHQATDKLACAAPNARDYYVQADESAFQTAAKQHAHRMLRLGAVIKELELIGEAIADQ